MKDDKLIYLRPPETEPPTQDKPPQGQFQRRTAVLTTFWRAHYGKTPCAEMCMLLSISTLFLVELVLLPFRVLHFVYKALRA